MWAIWGNSLTLTAMQAMIVGGAVRLDGTDNLVHAFRAASFIGLFFAIARSSRMINSAIGLTGAALAYGIATFIGPLPVVNYHGAVLVGFLCGFSTAALAAGIAYIAVRRGAREHPLLLFAMSVPGVNIVVGITVGLIRLCQRMRIRVAA